MGPAICAALRAAGISAAAVPERLLPHRVVARTFGRGHRACRVRDDSHAQHGSVDAELRDLEEQWNRDRPARRPRPFAVSAAGTNSGFRPGCVRVLVVGAVVVVLASSVGRVMFIASSSAATGRIATIRAGSWRCRLWGSKVGSSIRRASYWGSMSASSSIHAPGSEGPSEGRGSQQARDQRRNQEARIVQRHAAGARRSCSGCRAHLGVLEECALGSVGVPPPGRVVPVPPPGSVDAVPPPGSVVVPPPLGRLTGSRSVCSAHTSGR